MSKQIKPVNLKGNLPWILIGRTDAEAEAPILWPPEVKSWLTGEDPDAGKDWRQEEKGVTEDEVVGWHHWCNAHELGQALGDGEGQGSLACCSPWGAEESDTTWWLNKMRRDGQETLQHTPPTEDLHPPFLDFNSYLGLFYHKYMTFLLLLMPAASLPLIISIISLHHYLEKPSIISKAGNLLNWIRPRSGPKNPLLPREAPTTYSQCTFCLFVCFLGNPCHEISTYFSCVTQCWAYTKHSVSIHLIDLTQSEVF